MDKEEIQVSHADLYHKLGKLEGLMQTMMTSVSAFQVAMKDIHTRIDSVERRQTELENKRSADNGATSALTSFAKDFAIPVVAVIIAWFAGKDQAMNQIRIKESEMHQQRDRTIQEHVIYKDQKPAQ